MGRELTVALAGNPNSGKTTIFNNLTGARQKVGNYPGVTVEKKEGRCRYEGHEIRVVDLPGTYSLTAYSIEELVARNFVIEEQPDVVVDIVDASNLERNLYLALQFIELGARVVIVLNMSDVARARGHQIYVDKLSGWLGVPVVSTVGNKKVGMRDLLQAIVQTASRGGQQDSVALGYGDALNDEIASVAKSISSKSFASTHTRYSPRWLAIKLLENDSQVRELVESDGADGRAILGAVRESSRRLFRRHGDDAEQVIADERYRLIGRVFRESVRLTAEKPLIISDKIDRVVCNRALGFPIFLVLMYIVFQAVYAWSGTPMELIDGFFGWLGGIAEAHMAEGHLKSLVVDGLIGGVGGVIIFLPQILVLFFFISLLEDTGYMARAAFIMDRILARFGLHGKAFIPLLSSFACAIPGIMATRTMENRRTRLLTMMVVPLMSCAARLPIYALLIAAFIPSKRVIGGMVNLQGLTLFCIYMLGIFMAVLMVMLFKSTILKGEKPPFVMELPPYRIPTLVGVLMHMWERSVLYLRKAGTIILAVSILMWALFTFPSNPPLAGDYAGQRERAGGAFAARAGLAMEAFEEDTALSGLAEEIAAINEGFDETLEEVGLEEGTDAFATAERERRGRLAALAAQGPASFTVAEDYLALQSQLEDIDNAEAAEALSKSLAGGIGKMIEPVLRPLGFDWRMGIALVSGFAAKEVFVATMGQIYALGGEEGEDSPSLIESVRADPVFTPLVAVALMVFALLSSPCMATIAVVKQESNSWRWPLFMILYTNFLAWLATLVCFNGGRLLGLG